MAAGSLLLFLSLGVAGSAAPAHFGFRVLAHRHQIDRSIAFAPGTEDGGWRYSWWLMRWKHRAAGDRNLDFFGGITAGSGWLTVLGSAGVVIMIALQ
jgi:hypothetical protein